MSERMQGLVLDRSAPLFGRATAVLRIGPLAAGWARAAVSRDDRSAVEAFAVWGGIPRYWERPRELAALRQKAANLPLAAGKDTRLALWVKSGPRKLDRDAALFTPREVLAALR